MKISVVIPAYNEQDLLASCLKSLQAQTRRADEIIVVDNNSTDDTASIARSYGAKVIKEPVQGIMPATCAGLSVARGDVIARCDADSLLPPDWIRTIDEVMSKNPGAAGVTGPGKFYGIGRVQANLALVWYMYAYFVLVGSAMANWPLFGSNFAIRRSVWRAIAGKVHRDHADVHDDMDISIHIPANHRIVFTPKLTVGISARALQPSGRILRYRHGWQTLAMHWPERSPWRRWRDRLNLGDTKA